MLCNECGKTFRSRFRFKQHINRHDPLKNKRFICGFKDCNETFDRESRYIAHVNRHTNIKPYNCSGCTKKFSSTENLTKHMRVCIRKELFNCSDCSKSFQSSGALSVHRESEHKNIEFVCHCGKNYKYRNGLLNHKQKKKH